ncbi:hypothetical protein IFT98_16930 [Pseudomonas sp. CFBP 8770]|uniref:hypothetical protein n=1 Tax=unclassified Pseudomonas TaxID=196821 RepID=UPI00177CCEAC|nr:MULTISPECIES: hypothetical protein [unclassified Pseudomonas]MBD8475938.1 hypothetical protein [Pseudomonas sp. CFBP 8773]MBD8648679.1 hypothetical protein [Pseudomonas sp. CFBP 8770]
MFELLSLSGEVARAAPLASSVSKHFCSRPTLRQVARNILASELATRYPTLTLDGDHLQLLEPLPAQAANHGQATQDAQRYRRLALVDVLIDRYIHTEPIQLVQGYHLLTQDPTGASAAALPVAMAQLQGIVNEWGPQIITAYSQALCDYWGEVQADGSNRWQWLAQALQARLKASIEREKAAGRLDSEQEATALLLVSTPTASQRAEHDADPIEASLIRVQAMDTPLQPSAELTHALVIRRPLSVHGRGEMLLYTPVNGLESFATLQALAQAFADHMGRELTGSALELALYAPSGNVFEVQAQAILEQQLNALQTMGAYCQQHRLGARAMTEGCESITSLFDLDTAQERARLQALDDALPQWLRTASLAQRRAFSLYLATLALVREEQRGASFLDGIPTLASFAQMRLIEQIETDHPGQPLADLDDVEVHILTVPNAQLSLVNAGDMAMEDQQISLVELALFNLSGRPRGHLSVKPRAGAVLPDWTDDTTIQALVTRADAGGRYLQLLKRQLLQDPAQAPRRQKLFTRQLGCQLPLLALENSIRGQEGFTERGWRYVEQVMNGLGDLEVDGRPIGLRGLGFLSAPGMKIDAACNMYVFGALDGSGVQVLYRPLFKPCLSQYASAAALMEAISEPGELQRSVLDWLDVGARARYANGGFREPHLVRFGQGSDFAPISTPAPAALQLIDIGMPLLDHLYRTNVQALITLADRQSVSSAESRWIGFQALGWTLFNALLPILPGPLATAGWLVEAMAAMNVTLTAQAAGDPALVDDQMFDLLFNIALVLLAHGASRVPGGRGLGQPLAGGHNDAPVRSTWTAPLSVIDPANATLSFSWANAQHRLGPDQLEALATYRTTPGSRLTSPLAHGRFQGLQLDGERWLLSLGDHFYEVAAEEEQLRIVDARRPERPGPWLARDEVGRWRLDLRLRLRGGGPKRRIAALRASNQALMVAYNAEVAAFHQKRPGLHKRVDLVLGKLGRAMQAGDTERLVGLRQALSEATESYLGALRTVLRASRKLSELDPYADRSKEQAGALFQLCEIAQEEIINLRYKSIAYREQAHRLPSSLDAPELDATQSKAFFDFVADSTEVMDQQIQLSKELADWKRQLQRMPLEGEAALKKLKANWIEALSIQRWIGLLVDGLALTCIRKIPGLQEAERIMQSVAEPVRLAAQTHAALEESASYTLNDRVEVLNSLDLQYEGGQQALALHGELLGEQLHRPAFDRLTALIAELRDDAQGALVPLVREQLRMTRKQRQQVRHKTLYMTHRRGLVVGQRRPKLKPSDSDIIDVIDPIEKTVVASFGKDLAEGNWRELDVARAPRPRAVPTSVNAAVRRGNRLLQGAGSAVKEAWKQAEKDYLPGEVEDQLTLYARQLNESADAVEQQLTRHNVVDQATSQHASAHGRAQLFRDKAGQLIKDGRLIRIHMIKRQPPTAARVDYLYREQAVRISRVGGRSKLKRSPGYLEEYLIADTTGTPLWYAHFHYRELRSPRDQYTTAHLKTVEQRFDGVERQKADEAAGREVIGILRREIKAPFDEVYLSR